MIKFSNKRIKSIILGVTLGLSTVIYTVPTYAAVQSNDIEIQIAEQQKILAQLTEKRNQANTDALKNQLNELEMQLDNLKKQNSYDSKGAIDSLAVQIAGIKEQLDAQANTQKLLMKAIEKLDKLTDDNSSLANNSTRYRAHIANADALVNPGPQGTISYTQDAKNAQSNSTMVFSYAPDQLYKIYCRTGYLTDIELHAGEKISFVGGGDTSSWAINSTMVNGTPHIYIKPVVTTSTTNIIVTTNKRSYQLIVCTSNWYNPMVRWTYGMEEQEALRIKNEKDQRTLTGKLDVTDTSRLNFKYKIKVKGNKEYTPQMIFDDGDKTIIRFEKSISKHLPAFFIKEKGHKTVNLANFTVKNNSYILDRIIDSGELRYSDSDIITIEREK